MADIYYDWSSPTNGVGSEADPKNTWANPANGDRIFLKRGTTWVRTSSIFLSATALTFDAWGDISDPKPVITGTTTSSALFSFSAAGVHIWRNICFQDVKNSSNPTGATPAAINFGVAGVIGTDPGVSGEVHDCDFYDIGGNAIQFNGISGGSQAALAAERGVVTGCTFDLIGSDAVFAKVKTYFEVSYCAMTRLSMRDTNGDGVGFLDANPTLAWIHHNHINHTNRDSKQCVIIDGVDGSGLAVIEDNHLIGYGNSAAHADTHVVVNVDTCRAIVRRNNIIAAGYAISVNTDNSEVTNNSIHLLNYRAADPSAVLLLCSTSKFDSNRILVDDGLTGRVLLTGSGRTGLTAKHNRVFGASTFAQNGTGTSLSVGGNSYFDVAVLYAGAAVTQDFPDVALASGGTTFENPEAVDLLDRAEAGALITQAQHDANIAAIESSVNSAARSLSSHGHILGDVAGLEAVLRGNSAALERHTQALHPHTQYLTEADVSGATAKATPVDADTLALSDSAAGGALKALSWANLKATLRAAFDAVYVRLANIKTINGTSIVGTGDITVSGGTPGGNTTEVQFNDGGQLNGDPAFVFDKLTGTLAVTVAGIGSGAEIRNLNNNGFDFFSGGAYWLRLRAGDFRLSSTSNFGWASSTNPTSTGNDAYWSREGPGQIAQKNGANGQEYRTYGRYDNASNYRRLSHGMSNAGVAFLRPEGVGTGAAGNVLHISGLPTSNPGPGILWNDAGTVKVGT